MLDVFLTIAVPFALVLMLATGIRMTGRSIRFTPLLLGLACVLVYIAISILGNTVQHHIPLLSTLKWNWTGKIIVIIATLAMIRAIPAMNRAEVGLTWRQHPGPIWPIVIVIVAMCAIGWIPEAIADDGKNITPNRLLFQAIMPGLDEELFARGLLLALFVLAFGVGRKIAGGSIGVAGLAVTILFALGHGLRFASGMPIVDWSAVLIPGAIGALLVWLRQRTGSLLMPVLAHNLVNAGNSFF